MGDVVAAARSRSRADCGRVILSPVRPLGGGSFETVNLEDQFRSLALSMSVLDVVNVVDISIFVDEDAMGRMERYR